MQNASSYLHFASILDKVKEPKAKKRFCPIDRYQGASLPRTKQGAARPPDNAGPAQNAHRRSICPVACTLDLLGDKWTLLVVRDLMSGKSHFKEFLASPEKIATNILAERLARLAANGLVERYPSSDIAGREAYRLTEKGRSLRGLMAQIKAWGLDHIDGTEARMATDKEN
ncbi:winged helix-turn-helix transcriptional regulator [Collimonas humicola]|uniref:winged helix-turn-helix transcriptional regulator n=1 Tax=Collimonas humicola TaxID=2825886 RepID=UPI001E50131F|nr:helix-turn-helix domain-containing protein [Collimonas humicola]